MARPKHTSKEVEEVVAYAEGLNWRWRSQGHWGRLYCPHADRDGCQVGVFGTPKNPENHAKIVKQAIDRCPHEKEKSGEDENANL